MLPFVRRYRAMQGHICEKQVSINAADSSRAPVQPNKLYELVDMVNEMAEEQRPLEVVLASKSINASIQVSRSMARRSNLYIRQ